MTVFTQIASLHQRLVFRIVCALPSSYPDQCSGNEEIGITSHSLSVSTGASLGDSLLALVCPNQEGHCGAPRDPKSNKAESGTKTGKQKPLM